MVLELLAEWSVLVVHLVDDVAIALVESVSAFATAIRKKVLSTMVTKERTTRDDLAENLAEVDAIPVEDADRLSVALHHNHLPKLEDELYVEYDPRTGDVVRWKDPHVLETAGESM